MNNFSEIKIENFDANIFQAIGNQWMLVVANKGNQTNALTASWGGFGVLWNKNVAFSFIRDSRYTKEFLDSSEFFSLCFFDHAKYAKMLSYMGKVSGRDEDKIKKQNLSVVSDLQAPYFDEAQTVVICKKLYVQPFSRDSFIDKSLIDKNYKNGDFHSVYVGEIIKILQN